MMEFLQGDPLSYVARFGDRPIDVEPVSVIETVGFDPPRLEQLARQYSRDRFVHIPDLLYPDHADTLLAATESVPARRAICGYRHISWDEQNFASGHPVYQFFERPELVNLIQTLTGLGVMGGLTCWTSGYRAGEYINPHKDNTGIIQLLICLRAPKSPSNGGTLIVGGRELFLTPGAAVAFEATRLEHYTTPLAASVDEPNPRRVVLIGRYFLR